MKTESVLAYGLSLAFCAALCGLFFVQVPDGNRDMLYALLGTLGALLSGVSGYYFGSSVGSKQKTDLLTQKKKAPKL